MTRNSLILAILFPLAVWGCNPEKKATVSGTVHNPRHTVIKLWKTDINIQQLTDSVKLDKKGRFSFTIKNRQPEFFQLGYSETEYISILVMPGDRIDIDFRGERLHRDYRVSGSEETENIRLLEKRLRQTRAGIDSLATVYRDNSGRPGMEEEVAGTENEIYRVIEEQRQFSIEYILGHLGSMSSILALYQQINEETYVLYDSRDLQLMKLLSDTLTAKYPGSKLVKALAEDLARELKNMQMDRLAQIAETAEPMVLDPRLRDSKGKEIALSSLRGRYVLLTFWSAQSRECIANNLQLKDYYGKYHRKGFEIYQINVDGDRQAWLDAIRFDELPWINVREEEAGLRYMHIYNVQSLPANYLYDPAGNIIASNLFGRNLGIKLEQLFGL